MGSREKIWVVSLRKVSVDKHEADPVEDFFFGEDLETLGTDCEEAIVFGLEALNSTLAEKKKDEGFGRVTGKRGFGVLL